MLNERNDGSNNPISAITSLLIVVFVLVGLFYIAKFVFNILWWVSPILFIGSLILDHNIFLNYIKWIGRTFKTNPLLGIAIPVLSVVAFPIFALYMFLRAFLRKKAREVEEAAMRQQQGEIADFEELDSRPLELPPQPEPQPRNKNNEYEDLI